MYKFEFISADIQNKIHQGIYPVGRLLPSENDLAKTYDVSRETIRKAQKRLEDTGFIQKKQGKGAIVLDFARFSFPISGLTSYKELQESQHFQTATQVLSNKRVVAPDFLVGEDGVEAGEPFIHLIRAREIEGETVIVDHDYLRVSVIQDGVPDEIAEVSIYQYFEQELDLQISFANKEIVAKKADDIDQKHMAIGPDDFIIQVNSHVYLEDATFFQYTSSHHRIDKFRFAEFARRTGH